MKLGNKFFVLLLLLLISLSPLSFAEDKITSSPLVNLNELKPSFEELEEDDNAFLKENLMKKKKNKLPQDSISKVRFIGLDKITAKTTDIIVKLGESTRFGPLEIKVIKCGKINNEKSSGSVAYMQVKDLTENENEKVFIFNGWTFSSDPTLAPFDHAIYDLQLVNCSNV